MYLKAKKIIVKEASAPVISAEYECVKVDGIGIQVDGDFTSGTIKLQGKMKEASEWVDISLINLTGLDVVDSMTEAGLYQTSISAVDLLRVNVVSISGGSVSVIARIMEEGV